MTMTLFTQVLEFVGTFAFAISGIRLASAREFDWFGAYVVGVATAIGGGTLRDILLDVPVFWMTNPIYLICSGVALLWVIIFGKKIIHHHNTFFIFDSVGLALFTVAGVEKTLALGHPLWLAVVMGAMTGAAGGVLRDILINDIPLIFRKEIYAIACILGGLVYGLCLKLDLDLFLIELITGLTVFLIRILVVRFKICLPRLQGE